MQPEIPPQKYVISAIAPSANIYQVCNYSMLRHRLEGALFF